MGAFIKRCFAVCQSTAFWIFVITWLSILITISTVGLYGYMRMNSLVYENGKSYVDNTISETALYINAHMTAVETDILNELSSNEAIQNEVYFKAAAGKERMATADAMKQINTVLTQMRKRHEDLIESILLLLNNNMAFLDQDHRLIPYRPLNEPYDWFKYLTQFSQNVVWAGPTDEVIFAEGRNNVIYLLKWFRDSPSDAILVVAVKPEYIVNVLSNVSLASGGGVLIQTSDGQWLGEKKAPDWLQETVRSKPVYNQPIVYRDNGQNYWYEVRKLPMNDWNIIAWEPMAAYEQALKSLKQWIWSALLFGGILAACVTLLFAIGITSPLRKLSHVMKQAENGALSVKFEGRFSSEIAAVGRRFNSMMQQIHELIETVHTKERIKRNLEFQVLQSQMNPHFLYNTLDSIYWLSFKNGDHQVSEMAYALGRFFRLSLNNGKHMIRLADEIEHVNHYVLIQNIRFENRIRLLQEIDPRVMPFMIPKLILQPLVENCILHGFNEEKQGTIVIEAYYRDAFLIIEVTDNGIGFDPGRVLTRVNPGSAEEERVTGHALANLYHRCTLIYGEHFRMEAESASHEANRIRLIFPQQAS